MITIVSGLFNMVWTTYTLGLTVVVALSVALAIGWSLLTTMYLFSKLVKGEQIRLCSIRPVRLIETIAHETEAYLNETISEVVSWVVPLAQFVFNSCSQAIRKLTGRPILAPKPAI